MGLFQQKPEEHKQDWAGLPSEPWDRDDAAQLADTPVSSFDVDLGGGTTSFTLSVEVPAEDAPTDNVGP